MYVFSLCRHSHTRRQANLVLLSFNTVEYSKKKSEFMSFFVFSFLLPFTELGSDDVTL